MADAKPKKSKKNQERNPEIVLCKMFTGNYWENENNLGHETINMFVPDNSQEGESYIYLPASGDYKLDEHQIEHVLLVKSIAEADGKYVQVIGMAEVDEELLWDYKKDKSKIEQCLIGGTEFVGLCNLWKIEANNKGASLEEKINQLAKIYKIASFDVKNASQLAELAVKMGFIRREKKQLSAKELIDAYKKEECPDWLKLTDSNRLTSDAQNEIKKACGVTLGRHSNELNYKFAVEQGLLQEKPFVLSLEKFKNKIREKLKKAESLNQIHKEQGHILDLEYEGVQYRKIYEKNRYFDPTEYGLNIYASLRVKNLQLTDNSIILALDDAKIENKEGVIRLEKDWKKDLSSTKQTVYLPKNITTRNGELLLDEMQRLMNLGGLDQNKNNNSNDVIEDSFLTVIKKEYDELVYSNLFAYFFAQDRAFLSYFFNSLKDKEDKLYVELKGEDLKISTDYLLEDDEENEQIVKRELKNIDILIDAKDAVIVIENKIKSAINGLQYDINGEIVKDQLVKYYQYVEDNFATKSKKAYLIFAPDYNNIKEEEFKIKGVWKIVRYSKIHEICKEYMNQQTFKDLEQTDPIRKSYFIDFVKALNVHTDSSANNYYRQMQKRLLRIKNEQGKINETN